MHIHKIKKCNIVTLFKDGAGGCLGVAAIIVTIWKRYCKVVLSQRNWIKCNVVPLFKDGAGGWLGLAAITVTILKSYCYYSKSIFIFFTEPCNSATNIIFHILWDKITNLWTGVWNRLGLGFLWIVLGQAHVVYMLYFWGFGVRPLGCWWALTHLFPFFHPTLSWIPLLLFPHLMYHLPSVYNKTCFADIKKKLIDFNFFYKVDSKI